MINLVNDNGNIRVFMSEEEMKVAGFKKADLAVSEEKFNSNGCYARLVDGKIIVGRTEAEIAEAERQEQTTALLGELDQIDRDSGASREMRDISLSAGILLDGVRCFLPFMARKQGVTLPKDFGKGVKTGAEILALAPDTGATEEEKEEFEVFRTLLLLSHYDPATNEGMKRVKAGEMRAVPIRMKLAELTKHKI